MSDIRIFAGTSGREFAARMCSYLGIEPRPSEAAAFSEGNTYVKIGEHVRDEEVYLVQPIGRAAGPTTTSPSSCSGGRLQEIGREVRHGRRPLLQLRQGR
jgi:hypothetical protein